MQTPVEVQLWRLSALFLLGIGCNIVFHAYTAFRAAVSLGRLYRHFFDLLMAVFVLSSLALVIFIVNYGEIRLYVPVAIGLGFLTSNFLVGNVTYRVFLSLFRSIRKSLRWLMRTIIVPAKNTSRRILSTLRQWLSPPEPPGNGNLPPENPAD